MSGLGNFFHILAVSGNRDCRTPVNLSFEKTAYVNTFRVSPQLIGMLQQSFYLAGARCRKYGYWISLIQGCAIYTTVLLSRIWITQPYTRLSLYKHFVPCTLVQNETVSFRNYSDVSKAIKPVYFETTHISGIKFGFKISGFSPLLDFTCKISRSFFLGLPFFPKLQ